MPGEDGRTLRSDWPDPPRKADYHEPSTFGWSGYGWSVDDAPPAPWPIDVGPDFPLHTYGPPGTVWIFTLGDIAANWTGIPAPVGKALLKRALRKLGSYTIGGSLWAWRTPDPEGLHPPMTIKVIRTTIHAKFGAAEEIAHVMHWRSKPTADVSQDAAAIKTFADQLRDHWVAFLDSSGPVGSGTSLRQHLSTDVQYNEVRAAHLEISPGLKPVYLVPTQYSSFTGTTGNCSGSGVLPYEVAMCLSLNTALRGARHRGRTYLGGIINSELAGNGLFSVSSVTAFGKAYFDQLVTAMSTDSGNDLHVLSHKFGESYKVTGVRVGVVPDSQRRRRRKQLEAYVLAGGTAAGV